VTDVVDKKTRSRMMSGIKGKNTKPELVIRKAIFARGFRYRLHDKALPGRPDIVLPKYHAVIFVHGCYWHQHPGCRLAYSDRNYSEKWLKKFSDNRTRDLKVTEQLLVQGWRVAVIWECATREAEALEYTIEKLNVWINEDSILHFESDYRKT